MAFESQVFLDGDDYAEAMRAIGAHRVDDPAVIYTHREQWDNLYRYLIDLSSHLAPVAVYDSAPWGSEDDLDDTYPGGYVVAWNERLGYVSLTLPTGRDERHHDWVAGMMHVPDEDLDIIAAMRPVICQRCDKVYQP